jgi:ribosomal protein S18 acetylase RimI-like enzyme
MNITHLIKQVEVSDLEVVLDILEECATQMMSEGKDYWEDKIRDHPEFEAEKARRLKYVEAGSVYLIYDQEIGDTPDSNKAVGTITLSPEAPYFHADRGVQGKWKVPGKALYSGTLGVRLRHRDRGFGIEFNEFQEQLAREQGYSSIRLDVREKTTNMLRGVSKLGFELVHTYQKPEGGELAFFEKDLRVN